VQVSLFRALRCLRRAGTKLLRAGNLEIRQPVLFLGKAGSRAYCCRNGGIGKGMLKVFAPTPTPPWQELGGVVQMFLVEGHSAAQNM
jgi:hypothetical protein